MKNVTIYTDGACSGNPGKGGYGAVLLYNSNGKIHRKELSEGFFDTTNNQMELLGAIKALSQLKGPCNVTLYSDSKYLTDAINKNWLGSWKKNNWKKSDKKPVKNLDLWMEIDSLIKKHNVKFVWVKGHNDNLENERCDFLARKAIENI